MIGVGPLLAVTLPVDGWLQRVAAWTLGVVASAAGAYFHLELLLRPARPSAAAVAPRCRCATMAAMSAG